MISVYKRLLKDLVSEIIVYMYVHITCICICTYVRIPVIRQFLKFEKEIARD